MFEELFRLFFPAAEKAPEPVVRPVVRPAPVTLRVKKEDIDDGLAPFLPYLVGQRVRVWQEEKSPLHSGDGAVVLYLFQHLVREGDSGDEDGYGVEADDFAGAFLDSDGIRITKFYHTYSQAWHDVVQAMREKYGFIEEYL